MWHKIVRSIRRLLCNHSYVQQEQIKEHWLASKLEPPKYIYYVKLKCSKCGKEIWEQLKVPGHL